MILNDPPYGTERSDNGLRLALSRQDRGHRAARLSDGRSVAFAKPGQKTAEGYYNLERMLRGLAAKDVPLGACGTCMDTWGLTDADLLPGAHRSSMAELATWTLWADKVATF